MAGQAVIERIGIRVFDFSCKRFYPFPNLKVFKLFYISLISETDTMLSSFSSEDILFSHKKKVKIHDKST